MTRRTNLLFILSDQHAQRIAGCYGDPVVATPNIDRLAREGVVFDNVYCPSPVCLPSRMSMLTGIEPHVQQVWTNDDMLASDIPTMAHSMGAAGLRPTLIGRLHALGPDQLHGYVDRIVGDHSSNWPGVKTHEMGVLKRTNTPDRESIETSGRGLSVYEVKDVDVTKAAVEELRAIGARRRGGDDAPFALTVGLMLPHAPYVAQKEDYALYDGRVPAPRLRPPTEDHPWLRWWKESRGILTVDPEKERRARTAYYALVHRMDLMIGEILSALDTEGLADDTLVIYASDHGDHIGERGLWWKHTFYDESIKVPLVMRWKGVVPAGERRGQIVNLLDLPATIVDAMRSPALPNSTGKSFLAVAKTRSAPWIERTFAEYCTHPTPYWTGGMAVQQRMIRDGRWKLIYYHGYPPQLFDLVADPDEQADLAASPPHAEIRDKLLRDVLAGWDPDGIMTFMERRMADKQLIASWAQAASPPEQHRWWFDADVNRLDEDDAHGSLNGDDEVLPSSAAE